MMQSLAQYFYQNLKIAPGNFDHSHARSISRSTNQVGVALEQAVAKNRSRYRSIQIGTRSRDTEVSGVNAAEFDVQLSEEGAKDRKKQLKRSATNSSAYLE